MHRYLQSNCMLSDLQFGFRRGSSTQEALLSVTNSWHQLLSTNRQIGAVFFDIKKAFDSAPHDKIMLSLEKHGVRGPLLRWFGDYLRDRRQRVVCDRATSTPCAATCGVPQGSILGPLLFSCFMDSISELQFSPNTKLVLYADDILLYKPINNSQDTLDLQQDIDELSRWAGL